MKLSIVMLLSVGFCVGSITFLKGMEAADDDDLEGSDEIAITQTPPAETNAHLIPGPKLRRIKAPTDLAERVAKLAAQTPTLVDDYWEVEANRTFCREVVMNACNRFATIYRVAFDPDNGPFRLQQEFLQVCFSLIETMNAIIGYEFLHQSLGCELFQEEDLAWRVDTSEAITRERLRHEQARVLGDIVFETCVILKALQSQLILMLNQSNDQKQKQILATAHVTSGFIISALKQVCPDLKIKERLASFLIMQSPDAYVRTPSIVNPEHWCLVANPDRFTADRDDA